MEFMKAIVYERYGNPTEVLHVKQVPKPQLPPTSSRVLVKIHASSVNAANWHIIRGTPWLARLAFGLFRPRVKIPGEDIAGVVLACGAGVTRFKQGDEVFGALSASQLGAFAEYACVEEKELAKKPSGISMEQAAATPLAAMTALQGLTKVASVQPGQRVLVVGASGGVGSFAVQIAKGLGAQVTAVCHTDKMEFAKSLGASRVVDYTKDDVTRPSDGTLPYDTIFDAAAFRPFTEYKRILSPSGTYVLGGGSTWRLFDIIFRGWFVAGRGQRMVNFLSIANPEDLETVRELLQSRKIVPPVDRTFTLDEVPLAIQYMEDRKVKGKVVVLMVPPAQ
mmetsp:Transcript_7825/g.12518  ORF Transcript_7825/g.12518 Transcript_7825/m.12518 type:complete len:336 (+) Transcript_7825:356-1363(+)|eukprot:CAMPEP_0184649076 /NCGR_PEP_ID=MMETSP0308-20130426/6333_1 /TAXON_ID=38269 /ORGANISM="Gloeochaete witrockiana, Strain SAG 46.84" /LENGTH=335 /DNA_ID=CAMNT_0027081477 /DNA_START=347 /DNA_END=1354 /DNA_ORIENTATION=-